jgi:hypothetical protein
MRHRLEERHRQPLSVRRQNDDDGGAAEQALDLLVENDLLHKRCFAKPPTRGV